LSETERTKLGDDNIRSLEAKDTATAMCHVSLIFLLSLWLWYNLESATMRALAMGATFLTFATLVIMSLKLYAYYREIKKSADNLPNN